jgi:hypothetical protein
VAANGFLPSMFKQLAEKLNLLGERVHHSRNPNTSEHANVHGTSNAYNQLIFFLNSHFLGQELVELASLAFTSTGLHTNSLPAIYSDLYKYIKENRHWN